MSALVAFCKLSTQFNDQLQELVYNPFCGWIEDIGFVDHSRLSIISRPPRLKHVPYDNRCSDRFLYIKPGEQRSSIGQAEVEESLVYDNQMRGEIDFTGLKLLLTLNGDAFEAYREFVGKVRQRELGDFASWDGGVVFIIPTQPFPFPEPRGATDPWAFGSRAVGNLRPIESFAFDTMDVFKLVDMNGRRLSIEQASRAGMTQLGERLHLMIE
ncbi:hypothetical protein I6F07_06530 [Ensifer sp. IC4062]|nr:hypothetical protein [Ensifer sp. IC4062]MCA1439886.1 hypothetical protein [Ensifer sp. IC4062]